MDRAVGRAAPGRLLGLAEILEQLPVEDVYFPAGGEQPHQAGDGIHERARLAVELLPGRAVSVRATPSSSRQPAACTRVGIVNCAFWTVSSTVPCPDRYQGRGCLRRMAVDNRLGRPSTACRNWECAVRRITVVAALVALIADWRCRYRVSRPRTARSAGTFVIPPVPRCPAPPSPPPVRA